MTVICSRDEESDAKASLWKQLYSVSEGTITLCSPRHWHAAAAAAASCSRTLTPPVPCLQAGLRTSFSSRHPSLLLRRRQTTEEGGAVVAPAPTLKRRALLGEQANTYYFLAASCGGFQYVLISGVVGRGGCSGKLRGCKGLTGRVLLLILQKYHHSCDKEKNHQKSERTPATYAT